MVVAAAVVVVVQDEAINQELLMSPLIEAVHDTNDSSNGNDTIVYDIVDGNDGDLFRLDATSGKLFLLRQVDREQLKSDTFSLVIEASPHGDPDRFAVARVLVRVLDVNDNRPKFEGGPLNLSIVENLPAGFNVYRAVAVDPDFVSPRAISPIGRDSRNIHPNVI